MNISNLQSFKGKSSGRKVTIFSGTHGNETSGISATERLLRDISGGVLELHHGSLTIVPKVNERATEEKMRGIKDHTGKILDMNRFFQDAPPVSEGYEFERSRELMPIIKQSDFLLDLHSTSGPSKPFFFAEGQSADFALSLGGGDIVSGWSGIRSWDNEIMDYSPLAGDIESYATQHGAIGLTFEAGNHSAPDGVKNAYQVALNFLVRTGLILESNYQQLAQSPKKIQMDRTYIGQSDLFVYAFSVTSNFTPLKGGQVIGYDNNTAIYTPYDCILVMPGLDSNSVTQATGRHGKNIFQIGTYTS